MSDPMSSLELFNVVGIEVRLRRALNSMGINLWFMIAQENRKENHSNNNGIPSVNVGYTIAVIIDGLICRSQ
jgi:hypothetical protein